MFIEKLIKSDPRILLLDGVVDDDALRDERVSPRELEAAVRTSGHGDLAAIAAVVLETNGKFSVISRDKAGARTAFPQSPTTDRQAREGAADPGFPRSGRGWKTTCRQRRQRRSRP